MAERPFWETAYETPGASPFGEPSDEIRRLARTLPPASRVLDIGCGDGRNALCLAAAGHAVDAFDVSKAGIAELRRRAAGLAVRAWVEDAARFAFGDHYDLVVAHGVLHLLEPAARDRVLDSMRDATRPRGYHVVAVFTDALPPPPDLGPFMVGLFAPGELVACYDGWEVVESRAYVLEDEHPGGIRHRHPIEKVIARRRPDA